jgi:hypothetical protein
MTKITVFKELVLEVFDYASKLLGHALSATELEHGWTTEKRHELINLMTEWRQTVESDPDPGPHNQRHMIRWFLDNSVDTDGAGNAVLAIDMLLGSAT